MKKADILLPLLFKEDSILAGFTTRRGGVSLPPYDSLNFGAGTDDAAHIAENYRVFREYAGVSENCVALMEQVHGSDVRAVSEGGVYPDTDGLATDTRGLLLGVRVADCVPLLLFDPARQAAGAVHCGWRPITGGIIENAVECMVERFECRVSDVRAATGPSAGPCCYEVGADTAKHFNDISVIKRNNTLYIDLKAEITARLLDVGIGNNNIEHDADCTICNPQNYYSYRRDGDSSGRMMGFVMLK